MGRPRIYTIDENYFEKIDSKIKAYVVGFLYADGSISGKCLTIVLHERDNEILELIKKELNYSGPIQYKLHANTNTYRVLSIHSRKICSDLTKIGVIRNKTYDSKTIPVIDEKYETNLLMGIFDGDGSIYTSKNRKEYTATFCGNIGTLSQIKNMLLKYDISSNEIRYRHDTIFSGMLEIRGYVNLEKLFKLFYENNDNYLIRKNDKFNNFIEMTKTLTHRRFKIDVKNQIIDMYNNGIPQYKIADALGVPRSSVRGVVQRGRRDNLIQENKNQNDI